MSPKEKSISLVEAFTPLVRWKMGQEDYRKRAVDCALIAVEEIIKTIEYSSQADELSKVNYWQQVKKELV